MDWLAVGSWAGVGVIVAFVIGVPALYFARRQTRIAEEEQAARRERERLTEPPIPSPPPPTPTPPPPPKPVPPAFTNLPPDLDRAILGREAELERIDALLASAPGAAITPAAALHATGGVGKTALARLYAQRRRSRFEGVWWLPSEQVEETLVPAIDALGAAIGARAEGDAKARAAAIWGALAARDAPWLLVFDNAPDFATVGPWLAHGAKVRLLITARHDDFPPDRIPALALTRLSDQAAAEVIEREARRKDDRVGALWLAGALDGYALALVQAGAYARETTLSFDACRERIAAIIAKAPPADYPASVAATLELTLARIDADADTGPDEWALLRLMPWLAPEGIDARLVLDIPRCAVPDPKEFWDDIPPALHALAADEARLQRALTRLGQRGLATVSGAGPDRRAALHRVTALVLRGRLAAEATALRGVAAAVVAAGYPGHVIDRRNWPACIRLNTHVATLAADPPPTAAAEFLLNQAALYWDQQAETATALDYARKALVLKIARLGPDHPGTGSGHGTLGGMLGAAGDWPGAVAEGERALEIAEAQGPGHAPLGTMLSNLAWALGGLGVQQRAAGDAAAVAATLARREALQRRAWAVDRARFPRPGRQEDLATHLNNLGKTYHDQDRLRRARCFAAAALRIYRDALPPGDHRLAFPLHNLGAYHLLAGDAAAALPLLRKALDLGEDAFADRPAHPHRVGTAGWLARCLFALGEDAEAEALCARYALDPAERRALARKPDA